jgi:hypothetical protein
LWLFGGIGGASGLNDSVKVEERFEMMLAGFYP